MAKLGYTKKFLKLEERANKLRVLLIQKEDERNLMTRKIDEEINTLQKKVNEADDKVMQQFYDEGGDV